MHSYGYSRVVCIRSMDNYTLGEYELDTQSEGFQTAKKESSNYYSS